jgi:oleate hydratase
MDYSSGKWAAFARPRRPMGGGDKSAYPVGGGAVSPPAAFLTMGRMDGKRITNLEPAKLPGGGL